MTTFITELRNDKTRSNDELLLAEAMREVATPQGTGYHEGWRAWTGQWTPSLISQLADRLPLPDDPSQDLCKRLRRTSLQVGTILAQGARSIWAARCAAIAKIKYNNKQDERRRNHQSTNQRNNKASKMPPPEARITAFFPRPQLMTDTTQNPVPPDHHDQRLADTEEVPPTPQVILHNAPNFKKYSRRKPPSSGSHKKNNTTEHTLHAHTILHTTCITHKPPLEHRILNSDSSSLVRGHIE